MKLEELKQKVAEFDKKAGFDKTDFQKLIEMMKEEIAILEIASNNKKVVDHQLTDLLILIMQIAHRYNTDFDEELTNWFKKSEKYLK